MDIMELGAIGELVGGVAVIASLVFVGLQVRQSAEATRQAQAHRALDASADFLEHVSADPERAVLLFQGLNDFATLSEDEQVHFTALFRSCVRRWESIIDQSEAGVLRDSAWEGLRHTMADALTRPGSKEWWPTQERHFNTTFREFVKRIQAEAPDQSSIAIYAR